VSEAPKRLRPLLDAVLAWVVRESRSFRPVAAPRALALAVTLADWVLVASAALPFLAIAFG
jgi:hypothetical protein